MTSRVKSMLLRLSLTFEFQCIDDSGDVMMECFNDLDDDFFGSVRKMILSRYPWIHLSRCASHEVEALLELTYLQIPLIHRTLQTANLIFKCLHKHDFDLIPRRNHTRNWLRPSLIKFAIEFYVLRSVLEIEKELKALQLPNDQNVFAEADVVYKAIHSTEFWSNGKTVLQVLQPIFQVLELVDCNVSTSGYLYDAMKKVENAFKQHCEGDEGISAEFKFGRNRIITPMHAAAAFLNPAYMGSQNFTEGDEIKKGKWWECFGDRYPILQKYAIRILSETCSTSLCYPCDFRSNHLVDEFSMNMIMMENFRLSKSQSDLEPIAVDRISGLPEFADHEYVLGILESLD
ncbi:uncharacterized protein LOC116144802 [Pistacia vera]|uniref:uncharacterized protein LOC116144802 n=1 Tax=Pistacia vera TaxID=55513 RepID=UPI001263A4C9|nr:uncharacterized protein LOC116144802 [Pistacia vera]